VRRLFGYTSASARLDVSSRTLAKTESSTLSCVAHNAQGEKHKSGHQPGEWVQMLLAPACGSVLPARRTWAGALYPSDVEQKKASATQKAERRAADRRPGGHETANHENRHEQENPERHDGECCSTSDKRPRPEPAAADEMCAKPRLRNSHPYSSQFIESIAGELRGSFPNSMSFSSCGSVFSYYDCLAIYTNGQHNSWCAAYDGQHVGTYYEGPHGCRGPSYPTIKP
jgi:hypothetical protein